MSDTDQSESATGHDVYVFHMPRLVPCVILLIPIVFILLFFYAKAENASPAPIASALIPVIGFSLLASVFLVPKITIDNKVLTQRNVFGHQSDSVDLVKLSVINAKRGYMAAPGIALPTYSLKLVDEDGNKTTITLGKWADVATLKRVIATSPTGSDVDVNDVAIRLLHLG